MLCTLLDLKFKFTYFLFYYSCIWKKFMTCYPKTKMRRWISEKTPKLESESTGSQKLLFLHGRRRFSVEHGSHNRRTGATAMNHQSSRSHAVFTLTIQQVVCFLRFHYAFLLNSYFIHLDRQTECNDTENVQVSSCGSRRF